MAKWKIIGPTEAKQSWDKWLRSLNDYCLYQTFAWGAHKERIGQIQTRIGLFTDAESPVLMFQGHLKKLPFGVVVLWLPGGPIGDLHLLDEENLNQLKGIFGAKFLLIRSSLMRERSALDVSTLRKLGHSEAKNKINSGLSMCITLNDATTASADNLDTSPLRGASSNWKHNLRRGQKRAVFEQILNPNPGEISATYAALQETKKIGEQFSENSIRAMIEEFGENLIVFGSRDSHGKLVAMRACILVGNIGWDIWAAATDEARKNYTSHVLLEQLLKYCQNKKLTGYDLSGVDPYLASGVYNFKKGTGARHIEYLGEWDLGSKTVAKFLNCYLKLRSLI